MRSSDDADTATAARRFETALATAYTTGSMVVDHGWGPATERALIQVALQRPRIDVAAIARARRAFAAEQLGVHHVADAQVARWVWLRLHAAARELVLGMTGWCSAQAWHAEPDAVTSWHVRRAAYLSVLPTLADADPATLAAKVASYGALLARLRGAEHEDPADPVGLDHAERARIFAEEIEPALWQEDSSTEPDEVAVVLRGPYAAASAYAARLPVLDPAVLRVFHPHRFGDATGAAVDADTVAWGAMAARVLTECHRRFMVVADDLDVGAESVVEQPLGVCHAAGYRIDVERVRVPEAIALAGTTIRSCVRRGQWQPVEVMAGARGGST